MLSTFYQIYFIQSDQANTAFIYVYKLLSAVKARAY